MREFRKLSLEEINHLRKIVDDILWASTKSTAKVYLQRLEFQGSTLRGSISPYGSIKLSEVISYAKAASGQVRDKSHWERMLENSWSVFKSEVKNREFEPS